MRFSLWRRREEDLEEEIRSHLQMAMHDRLERGESAEQASEAAGREFGSVSMIKEVTREMWSWRWLDQIGRDLRYGLRMLARSPGFAMAAVLTLALTIGAASAIFSVVNGVLLKELPYPDPEQLVLLWGTDRSGNQRAQVSFTDLEDWRRGTQAFAQVVAYSGTGTPILSGSGDPERVAAMQVSDGYFGLMKAPPLLGRVFLPEDQQKGQDDVAVLSFSLWQGRFGQDPSIVGQTISLDSRPYTVIGVMPQEFRSLPTSLVRQPADVYLPLATQCDETQRSWTWMRGIARLKPGVSLEQAQSELDVIAGQQQLDHPATNSGRGVRVVTLQTDLTRNLRLALLILQGSVLLVVLIGCVNLANLLLARLTARRTEIALRSALGAGRLRLIRQMLTESLLLSLMGGGCGLILTLWGVNVLGKAGAKVLPELSTVRLDLRVLAFAAGLSLLTGIIFGLAPAMHISGSDMNTPLKEAGRDSGASFGRRGARRLLVVSEVALSLVLLAGGALLVRSFLNLTHVNPGFDPNNALTVTLALPEAKYPPGPRQAAFFHEVLSRIQRLPGVEHAGATSVLPESGNFDHVPLEVEGRNYGPGERPTPDVYRVSPDYFRALAIPLLHGRFFSEQDDRDHPRVALINETMARQLWPGEDPVGKRIWSGIGSATRTIVGVVGDVYQYGLDTEKTMQLYVPYAENPGGSMTLVVRGAGNSLPSAPAIRSVVREVDSDQVVYEAVAMDQVLSDSVAGRRFSMSLLALFAAGALVLAAVGVYGVVAYAVTQRRHEFGIRLALGARQRDVILLVLRDGMKPAVIGIAFGLAGTFAAGRVMVSLLFGVSSADITTFFGVAVILGGVALLACYLPALKAARVDPATALRCE
jgi:putative ABC transport system permease protein